MRKTFIGTFFAAFAVLGMLLGGAAAAFDDVLPGMTCHEAVTALAAREIISGYPDGTFAPDAYITRTEAAVIVTRTNGTYSESEAAGMTSTYNDVDDDFWGMPYIMLATRDGILAGMGNGDYAPSENVTYFQIVKMAVCTAGLAEEVETRADRHWALGYLDTAVDHGLIGSEAYYAMRDGSMGNMKATRANVAIIMYQTLKYMEVSSLDRFEVAGRSYTLGMDAILLGEPEEVLDSVYGFDWYVYGTDTYEDFFAAGVEDGKIVSLVGAGESFAFRGMTFGSARMDVDTTHRLQVLTDKNDGDIVCGLMLSEHTMSWKTGGETALSGESRLIFHLTNAFRTAHGKKALHWSDKAAAAARAHSADMASRDYFSHDSPEGENSVSRMEAHGVTDWRAVGENVNAGYTDAFLAYGGWVNSAGHRENMLNDFEYLGVGGGYDTGSTYGVYFTEDFYSGY